MEINADMEAGSARARHPAPRRGPVPPRALPALLPGLISLAGLASCAIDDDRAAPYVGPPTGRGECGSTDELIPRFLAFLDSNALGPVRSVIEQQLLPSPDNPAPDPSLPVLLVDVVQLLSDVGLARTELVLDVIKRGQFESQVAPLLTTALQFLDGRLDGQTHYAAGDAAAVFVRQCNPDYLLAAIEDVLRLRSPSHAGLPWLFALIQDVGPLVDDPTLVPFLMSFQNHAATGRAAIIAILAQIMVTTADPNFKIDHIETLLRSAVYPAVSPTLRGKVEPLVRLLDEATRPEAGILEPLQNSIRCGLAHPPERDELLGLAFDLVVTKAVGLARVIDAVNAVLMPAFAADELDLFADFTHALRTDLAIRDDLRALAALLLSTPQNGMIVPVLIDLVDQGVVTELIDAFAKLLVGCKGG